MVDRENQGQDLTELQAHALSRLARKDSPIVTTTEVERTLDLHPKFARKVVATLCEKGHVEKMTDGQYLVITGSDQVDEFVVASALVEPMYVGFWSALYHHDLVERASPSITVATTTNAPNRMVQGVTYQLVPLIERKFFGYRPTADDREVNVATVEKALVDCADHPKYCGGIDRLAAAMAVANRDGCSWETVVEHLHRVDNGAAKKRILYLADHLGIDLPERGDMLGNVTTGYSPLDPTREDEGRYDSTYRLQVNAEPESFLPDTTV